MLLHRTPSASGQAAPALDPLPAVSWTPLAPLPGAAPRVWSIAMTDAEQRAALRDMGIDMMWKGGSSRWPEMGAWQMWALGWTPQRTAALPMPVQALCRSPSTWPDAPREPLRRACTWKNVVVGSAIRQRDAGGAGRDSANSCRSAARNAPHPGAAVAIMRTVAASTGRRKPWWDRSRAAFDRANLRTLRSSPCPLGLDPGTRIDCCQQHVLCQTITPHRRTSHDHERDDQQGTSGTSGNACSIG